MPEAALPQRRGDDQDGAAVEDEHEALGRVPAEDGPNFMSPMGELVQEAASMLRQLWMMACRRGCARGS